MFESDHFLMACRKYGLVLDTNILLIFIVGLYDKNLIGHDGATEGYTEDDFDSVLKIVGVSKRIIIPSYVLAEVSNKLPIDKKPKKRTANRFSRYLQTTITFLKSDQVSEKHIGMDRVIDDCALLGRFGVADTSIVKISDEGYAVLTNDGELNSCLSNSLTLGGLRSIRLQLS